MFICVCLDMYVFMFVVCVCVYTGVCVCRCVYICVVSVCVWAGVFVCMQVCMCLWEGLREQLHDVRGVRQGSWWRSVWQRFSCYSGLGSSERDWNQGQSITFEDLALVVYPSS